MSPYVILVTGSRDWSDRMLMEVTLDRVAQAARNGPILLRHGDARGADRMAAEVANRWGWTVEAYPADWGGDGKAAGPKRNAR